MQWVQVAKDGLLVIEQLQPQIAAAAQVAGELTVIGTAGVKVLQQGKKLCTYLVGKLKKKPKQPENQEILQIETPDEIELAGDVAVLVDINRRLYHDVVRYLDEQGIDANIVLITNSSPYTDRVEFLPVDAPDEWEKVVQEFNTSISRIKHEVGGAHLHFFFSAPLALTFALGCVWGTVDEATAYHWQDGTYYPEMRISRKLRQ